MNSRLSKRVPVLALFTVLCLSLTLTGFIEKSHSARAATAGPDLTVDVSANRHAINSNIYGMSFYSPDAAFQKEQQIPILRWGGDATTNYNWLQDSSNAGSDWYFIGGDGTSNPTPGASADTYISTAAANGGQSLITIPLIGYVNNNSQWHCSYPESLYPNQQSWDPYLSPNGVRCGNGKDAATGNNLTDNNVARDYIQVDPTWMKAWVQHLIQTHGTAAAGGVGYYQMDNEPELWHIVHFDVHPAATGFDEVVNDNINYASMVKATDPTAQIVGPSDGYPYAYFHLGDLSGDDINAHGMPWLPYYLQKMHDYQQKNGVRLLDSLDVHYYGGGDNTDAGRLDSTRGLWDPTYTGPNAVGPNANPPMQIGLIPLLKTWVNKYYPGTKTSISEYDYGDHTGIVGALTEADVLGIYGREGLDQAEWWGNASATDAIAFGFGAYLNFDGNGAKFGDVSVQSSSSNQGQLSIYSAQRSRDNALTLQIINKTTGDLTSTLNLSNFNAASTAHVYTYTGADLTKVVQQPDLAVSSSGFTATYPAHSITTIVIPQQGTPYLGGAAANPAPSKLNTLQPDASSYSLFVGQTYQTGVVSIDANGVGTPVTSGVTFSSDNTAVATVDANGVVTAHGAGIAHITGTYQGKSFTVTVTSVALQSVTLDAAYTLPLGAQHQTTLTAVYSDGSTTPIDASSATYSSDNTTVATVSASGIVTAVGQGTAHITATYNGLSGTTTVTVPATQPLPSDWKQTDIGAVATPGTVAYANGAYNVTGAGADVWGNNDQGHFVYQTLHGDGTIIARMTGETNVNQYAKGGLMLRQSLNSGGTIVYLAMFPGSGVQLDAGDANASSITGYWGGNPVNFPYWLKLDRTGNVITASVSADGKTWTQLPNQFVSPKGNVYVGLFSDSHGAPLMNTSSFDNVSVIKGKSTIPPVTTDLPEGWTGTDLGQVGGHGHAGYQNGTFTLQGTGMNVIGGSDSAYFVYHRLTGDATITARVATQGNSNPYAEAGLMIRDGLQYGANVAYLGISPTANTRLNVGSATATNGIANVWQCGCAYTAPYWLRLTRIGGTLTAYTSSDGVTWTQQAQASFPTGVVYIGLATDAVSAIQFNTVTFDNVTLDNAGWIPPTPTPTSTPTPATAAIVPGTTRA